MLKYIDWGANHCAFIDHKGRMFTMGKDEKGRLGTGKREIV